MQNIHAPEEEGSYHDLESGLREPYNFDAYSSHNGNSTHNGDQDQNLQTDMSFFYDFLIQNQNQNQTQTQNQHQNHRQNRNLNQTHNQNQARNLGENAPNWFSSLNYPSHEISGPISAPATTVLSDDYFLFTGIDSLELDISNAIYGKDLQSQTLPHHFQNKNFESSPQSFNLEKFSTTFITSNGPEESQQGYHTINKLQRSNSSHNPNRTTRRRTFSSQRPFVKSSLSMSYRGYPENITVTVSSPQDEPTHDENSGVNKSQDTFGKKNRNPGFRLKLDNLEPRVKKIMSPNNSFHSSTFRSPGNGNHTDRASLKLPSSAGALLSPTGPSTDNLDMSFSGDQSQAIDFAQDNVTPLMFPPQNQDYFGEFSDGSSLPKTESLLQGGQYVGYFGSNIPKESKHGEGTLLDEFQHQNSKRNFEQYSLREEDYFNEPKAEAHFTPLSYGSSLTPNQPPASVFQNLVSDNLTQQNSQPSYHLNFDEIPGKYNGASEGQNQQQEFLASPHGEPILQNMHYFDRSNDSNQGQYSELTQSMQPTQPTPPTQPTQHMQQQFPQFQFEQETKHLDQLRGHMEQLHDQQQIQYGFVHEQQGSFKDHDRAFQGEEQVVNKRENVTKVVDKREISQGPEMVTPLNVPKERSVEVLPRQDATEGSETQKKRPQKGTVCTICDRYISRDFSRHMRIHDESGRFKCVFPPGYCNHKLRKFNRPYDYKKHLLNMHFRFDDVTVKLAPNLTEKLSAGGHCTACGERFTATEWLETHILGQEETKCYKLKQLEKALQEGWLPQKNM